MTPRIVPELVLLQCVFVEPLLSNTHDEFESSLFNLYIPTGANKSYLDLPYFSETMSLQLLSNGISASLHFNNAATSATEAACEKQTIVFPTL